jgi:hypothetical protein
MHHIGDAQRRNAAPQSQRLLVAEAAIKINMRHINVFGHFR